MPARFGDAGAVMSRALELASRGIGAVEPNPPVGAVLVDDQLNLIAEGYHRQFGGPHAEIEAIREGDKRAAGATLFVTLEPCCHRGKTGPCTEAIVRAGIRKVVVALRDPFPEVDGKGIDYLRSQGIGVEVGLREAEARQLAFPFVKLVTCAQPWIHAKWAMSLDGKIATRSGDSRWISNEASRAVVHRLRGRMDAIVVGAQTARLDDPLLTARPPGPRLATRIVIDADADLPLDSQLVRTARDIPLLIAVCATAPSENIHRLSECGAEVLAVATAEAEETGVWKRVDINALLTELGRRRFTNVLVEGGARLLGAFFDGGNVDEVHVFVAPKIIGGAQALTAVAGRGLEQMSLATSLEHVVVERTGDDVYINGRRPRPA